MHETLFARAGLSLDRLRSFREIVVAQGISAAAQGEPNRQSQLSRQLRELETFFGTELLVRGRGPLRLTPAGAELNRLCGGFLSAAEEFLNTCAQAPIQLTVGAGESLVHWWLLPGLARQAAQPRRWTFTFENLRNDEMLDRVLEASLDLAVTTRPTDDNRLRAEAVGSLDYGLFVPRRLLTPRQGSDLKRVLDDLPLAVLSSPQGAILRALESEAARTRHPLRIELRLSSYPQLAMAVREGMVAAIMPTQATAALDGADYELLHPAFLRKQSRKVWLVWNRSLVEVRPAIAAAAKQLKEALRGREMK